MENEMSGRLKVCAWMIMCGCFLFVVYGVLAAVLNEIIAAYQYGAFTGKEFQEQPEEMQSFCSILVMLIGLLGAGLAVASGALFWLGLSRRLRSAFLAGLIGGALGLAGLIIVHMDQKAWILFAADNICLFFISTGITIATREILDLIRGKAAEGQPERA